MSTNNTPADSAFEPCLTAPLAAAAREILYDDALASFGGSRTPIALALREALFGAGATMAFMAPKVVVVVKTDTVETPAAASPQRVMNVTAQWLAQNAKEVYKTLVGHLNSKMQRSSELGVVEDHVQEFLARLVNDDRLAPLLTTGETPKLAVLRVWAYQSACTELRRWGVDATLRATRNAKTSREVQKGKDFQPVQSPHAASEITTLSDDGSESTHDLCDPMAPSPEDVSARRSRVDHVRATLIRKGQSHLVPVVDGLLEGQTLQELQIAHGVSETQITSVLRGLRA
jgi:hypothetical protein